MNENWNKHSISVFYFMEWIKLLDSFLAKLLYLPSWSKCHPPILEIFWSALYQACLNLLLLAPRATRTRSFSFLIHHIPSCGKIQENNSESFNFPSVTHSSEKFIFLWTYLHHWPQPTFIWCANSVNTN